MLVTVRQCAAMFEVVKPLFGLRSTHCKIAKSLLNLAKLDAVLLLHAFSHIGRNAMR
jgi:hypothetical protein